MAHPVISRSLPQLVLSFVLLCLFLALSLLLDGACNHELAPSPELGNGAGGANGGGDGAGGANMICIRQDYCVRSCSAAPASGAVVPGYCDATGAFACPPDTVRLSTCAPDACVQVTPFCCDETTGGRVFPPCGPDGLKQACPAGSHLYDFNVGCIPAGLGVTNCYDLKGPCNLEDQMCSSGQTLCRCVPAPAGGALSWQCATMLP
jgi:hypothetical protein